VSRDEYDPALTGSMALSVGDDVPTRAAVDHDVLQPGYVTHVFQLVSRPGRDVSVVVAGRVACRERDQMREVRLQGRVRHLVDEILDPGHRRSTFGAPITHVEDDLIVPKGLYSVTRLVLSFEPTHPVRIQLHQQKAAPIDENSGVRVLLLKEAPILHHYVQVLPLHVGLSFR